MSALENTSSRYPSRAYAYYVIGVLMLVTLLSLLDRNLTPLLVGPIRRSLEISDTQVSLIHGSAFALIYTVMGLPFGRLVDRTSRRDLILAGLLLWSTMTVLSGLATSFWQLFLARMGLGLGEACLAPAAYSLIADYTEPSIRGRALSVYYCALLIGGGASLLVGGAVLRMLPAGEHFHLPLVRSLEPWQIVFVLAGAPGLLFAPLLLTVREVPRLNGAGAEITAQSGDRSIAAFVAYVRRHPSAFGSLYSCYTLVAFVALPVLAWSPTFYVRHFGLDLPTVGLIIGLTTIGGGALGSTLSGVLSDRFAARGKAGTRLRVTAVAWILMLPALVVWPLTNGLALSIALLTYLTAVFSLASSSAPSAVQDLVPNHMRGQAIAIYLLLAGLVGMGLGPTAVALVTDYIFRADAALPYSLICTSVPGALLGLLVSLRGFKAYDQTRAALLDLFTPWPTDRERVRQ